MVYRRLRFARVGQSCPACGKAFIPTVVFASGDATLCPNCAERAQPKAELAKQTENAEKPKTIGCAGPVIVSGMMALGILISSTSKTGIAWDMTWFSIIGIVVALVVLFVLYAKFRLEIEWWLHRRARKITGEQGLINRLGTVCVWSAERAMPFDQLEVLIQEVRTSYEKLLGPSPPNCPLRIFNFANNSYLAGFFGIPAVSQSSIYYRGRNALIVFGWENEINNLDIPRAGLANTLAMYLTNQRPTKVGSNWVSLSIDHAIVNDQNKERATEKYRRLKIAVARNRLLSTEEWLLLSGQQVVKRYEVKNLDDPYRFDKLFYAQCCSLGDFLLGHGATDERRGKMKRFVLDPKRSEARTEEIFARHFGYGYDQLWTEWRAWLETQLDTPPKVPPPKVPPPELLEKIEKYFLPIIRDPLAPLEKRLLLVRKLGEAGYVFGADTLIELIAQPQPLTTANVSMSPVPPPDELRQACICSLELISGQPLGDNPDGWKAW